MKALLLLLPGVLVDWKNPRVYRRVMKEGHGEEGDGEEGDGEGEAGTEAEDDGAVDGDAEAEEDHSPAEEDRAGAE